MIWLVNSLIIGVSGSVMIGFNRLRWIGRLWYNEIKTGFEILKWSFWVIDSG